MYKASKQREYVYDCICATDGHCNAETIFEVLQAQKKKVSLATVYRNLNILTEMQKIKKIALPQGYVYDKATVPHDHFYCTKCHRLYDLPSRVKTDVEEAKAFADVGKIEGYDITIHGVCKNCLSY